MEEIFGTFGLNTKLIVIQAINFGVLLTVLWYFLYRPLMAMLEKRQKVIEKGIQDAKQAEVDRSEIAAEKQTILTNATSEAEQHLKEAKQRAKEKETTMVAQAQKKVDTIIEDAQAKGEEIKNRALKESREEIAQMAILGAERILRERA